MLSPHRRIRWTFAVAVCAAFIFGGAAPALAIDWDGGSGVDDNWSTAANWNPDGAPANPIVGGDDIVFIGAVGANVSNVDAPWGGVDSFDFTGALGAFTITGSPVTFTALGAVNSTTAFDHVVNVDLVANAAGLGITQNAAGNSLTFGNQIDLTAGGALTITPTAGTVALNGAIVGAGAVNVGAGAGIVNLNGNNTFAGGLNVTGGIVTLSHANAAGTGAVTMNAAGGELRLDRAGDPDVANNVTVTQDFTLRVIQDAQMSGVLTGLAARTITKVGPAEVMITGDSLATYLGAFDNNVGTLRLDGRLGGNVNNAANMQGVGTVGGNLVNQAGGVLNPGNSPGIINVVGNFTNNTGATLVIELQPGGNTFPLVPGTHFDQVNVGGVATLQANSIVTATTLNKGYIADGDMFDAITAFGGVVDGGALVGDNANFMTFTGQVVGNNFRLTANRVTYTTGADTFNRTQVARGLDYLAAATPQTSNNDAEIVLAELDWLGPGPEFRSALDYLSPERYDIIDRVHQRTTHAFLDAHREYMARRRLRGGPDMIASRSDDALGYGAWDGTPSAASVVVGDSTHGDAWDNEYGTGDVGVGPATTTLYVQPLGQIFEDEHQDDALGFTRTGYDADMVGFLAGLDRQIDPTLVTGMFLGYGDINVDFRGLGGEASIDSIRVGGYAGKELMPRWYLDGAVSYGFHRQDATRPIIVGTLSRTTEAEWYGHDVSLYSETGVNLIEKPACEITPFVGFGYSYFYQEEFEEEDAQAMNLVVADQDTHTLATLVGMRLAATFGDKVRLTPAMSLGWRHEFMADSNDDIEARFRDAPHNFEVRRGDPDVDAINFQGSLAIKACEWSDVNVYYNGDWTSDSTSHAFGLTWRIIF